MAGKYTCWGTSAKPVSIMIFIWIVCLTCTLINSELYKKSIIFYYSKYKIHNQVLEIEFILQNVLYLKLIFITRFAFRLGQYIIVYSDMAKKKKELY